MRRSALSFPSIAPTLGVASQSLPQDVSTPGSASNPLAAVLAAIQAAHGSTMGHLGTLAASAAKASTPKQPASGAPSQGNAAPGGQTTPQSPMQGNMPPLSPPSMPALSPPNQNGSLAQGSNPLPQPNFQQFGSAPQPGGNGPSPMSGQGGSGVPPELAGILANADNMAARSGSYFDQGRADLDEMNRQKMTAANMAPPQMQGPWNKQSLMGTALGLLLNGLMRGGNAGAAGMVQGATQGANQTAQIGNQNAMARFEQQRGVPLTAAEIAGQKAQTEFGRGGAMLNYSTEIQKAVAPAVARGAYLLKAAMINGRRSLAVANIRAAAGQYTDPQLRAGFMRGTLAADQQLNPDEPPIWTPEEIKAAGILTPGQNEQVAKGNQDQSVADFNGGPRTNETEAMSHFISGPRTTEMLAAANQKNALASYDKAMSYFTTQKGKEVAPLAQSEIALRKNLMTYRTDMASTAYQKMVNAANAGAAAMKQIPPTRFFMTASDSAMKLYAKAKAQTATLTDQWQRDLQRLGSMDKSDLNYEPLAQKVDAVQSALIFTKQQTQTYLNLWATNNLRGMYAYGVRKGMPNADTAYKVRLAKLQAGDPETLQKYTNKFEGIPFK